MANQTFGQLFLFTFAPLHIADRALQTVGLLPRDSSHLPLVPASTIHGALRGELRRALQRPAAAPELAASKVLFGLDVAEPRHENAPLQATDCQIVCLPLRTVRGHFVWLASTSSLQQVRNSVLAAQGSSPFEVPAERAGQLLCGVECVLAEPKVSDGGSPDVGASRELQLEEYTLSVAADPMVDTVATWLASFALPQTAGTEWWREKFRHSFVVAPDAMFAELAQAALVFQSRAELQDSPEQGAVLDRVSGKEFLPADTVLCSTLSTRGAQSLDEARDLMKRVPLSVIQVGAEKGVGAGVVYCRTLL